MRYSTGNYHRIDRVYVLRAFLAGGPGLAEASARQELSRIRDSVSGAPDGAREVASFRVPVQYPAIEEVSKSVGSSGDGKLDPGPDSQAA